jgi:two-component system KDP operon response regulator KdpE
MKPLFSDCLHDDATTNFSQTAVLLVEHDAEIRSLVRFGLEQQGFGVMEASTGDEVTQVAIRCRPGVILLDMGVTQADALTVIKRVRERSRVPILALSGRVNGVGAVAALDHGANDYIRRPFCMAELSARLRAAQRDAHPANPEIFQSGSLNVDLTTRIVRVAGRTVKLSATEYALLRLFVCHAGKVLNYPEILHAIWGWEMADKTGCLRVYLLSLRRKLANPPEPDLLITERAVGCRLVLRDSEPQEAEVAPVAMA